jgi:hypothetical protein
VRRQIQCQRQAGGTAADNENVVLVLAAHVGHCLLLEVVKYIIRVNYLAYEYRLPRRVYRHAQAIRASSLIRFTGRNTENNKNSTGLNELPALAVVYRCSWRLIATAVVARIGKGETR